MVELLLETLIEIQQVSKSWEGDIWGRFISIRQSILAFGFI